MKLSKSMRFVVITLGFVFVLSLPFFIEIHYRTLYYSGAILLIPIGLYRVVREKKFEEGFCKKWDKAREQGFWINAAREGMRTFVSMIAIVSITELFVHGFTPFEIMSKLSGYQLVFSLLFLSAWSLLVGIVAWYEKEKRYHRFLL